MELWEARQPVTLRLAPVIGAYLLLSAAGFLRGRASLDRFVEDVARSPALTHTLGAVAFFVGAGIVSFHHHWSSLPEIAVSATGCWWAFEGAGMLASPAAAAAALSRPAHRKLARASNLAALAVGAYLLLVTAISTWAA